MTGTIIKNEKFFNTAGLCFPENHYMVNPLPRLEDVEGLIKNWHYFTIHAPRQTDKATYLHAMARKLNGEGKYTALVVSFEQAGYSSITVKEANALARQIVSKILKEDFSQSISLELVYKAKQQLIMRRDTHLDSLEDKLKEDRVKKIVQTIINGDNLAFDILDDDIAYVRDLGIVGQSSPIEFANPIYAEIIPRIMSSPIQESMHN